MVKRLLMTYILLIVLPLTTVSVISFLLFKKNMELQISNSMERTMILLHREVDAYFAQFLDLAESIMLQRNILDTIQLRNLGFDDATLDSEFESYQQIGDINVYITFQILNKNKDIRSVHLYTTSKEVYYAQRYGTSLSSPLLEAMNERLLNSGREWIFVENESDSSSIFLLSKINEPFTGKFISLMIIEIQLDTLYEKITSALLPRQDVVLLGHQQLVVYDPVGSWERSPIQLLPHGSSLPSMDIIEPSGRVLVTHVSSESSEWNIISYMEYSVLSHFINKISFWMIVVCLICILLSIFTAFGIAKGIVMPIQMIRNAMRKLAQGNFTLKIPVKGKDEVAELSKGFNLMSEQLQHMINQMYVVKLEQKEAELRALQAQIDPHFLYNTLDAIRMTAEMEGSSNAGDMISSLAVLFRAATEYDTLVTIETELNLIRHYAKIQEIRFDGEFSIQFQVEEQILHLMIPKFTLQPLVENSFIHGLMPMRPPRSGSIHIRGYLNDKDVIIEINDNGVGMEETRLTQIMNRLKLPELFDDSVGIHNVHKRIRLKWGENYGVSLSSQEASGTSAIVKIPIIYSKEVV